MVRACSSLAVALLVPAIAVASPTEDASPPKTATIVVDFAPAPGAPQWIASAFEQTIVRELSGFERITPVAKTAHSARACGTDLACRVRVYREAAIDIVLFGHVGDGEIGYELYQTWTPARLATGSIPIGRDQSTIGLKHATRDVLHPVLKHGGLLDQRPHAFELAAARTDRTAGWSVHELAILFGAVLAFALPFGLLALWSRSTRAPGQRRIHEQDPDRSAVQRAATIAKAGAHWITSMRSARRVALLVAAIVVAPVVLDPRAVAELVESWPWVFAGAGGLAWGAFLVVLVRAVFPPLDGFTRVGNHDLPRILRTWWLLGIERFVLLAVLYAPFGWFACWLEDALAIPEPWTIVLLAPLLAFAARLWLASWVECLAFLLDRRFVEGVASRANPWSRELADYLMGYVRRTGWDLEPELLRSVVLLPGKPGTGIVSYGGGSTHARIVVDKQLLELAIGPVIEVKPDEKPALWPDWTAAVVVPHPGPSHRRATTLASSDDFRGRKLRPSYPGIQRKPLGQAATLLGYVLPEPGQIAPLISDNPKDLAVLREMLSEHYPWFAPDPDDEFDATDPSDKDMLFGALARELGIVRRQETQLATVKLLLGVRVAGLTSRYRSRIADSYAALNFARHHLIQYLHYLRTQDTALLTARASSDRLHHTSTKMLDHAAAAPRTRAERSLRARLAWLSQFFAEPIADPRQVTYRRLTVAAIAVAVLAAAGIAVKRAIDYSPTYAKRIEAQEREVARLKKLNAERAQEKDPHEERPKE